MAGLRALMTRQFQELKLKDAIIMWGGFERGRRPSASYRNQVNRGGKELQNYRKT